MTAFPLRLGASLLWVALSSCAGPDVSPSTDAGIDLEGTRVVFEPADAPFAFGSVPFPDDLYRDEEGKIRVAPSVALGSGPLTAVLLEDQAGLDGFGVHPTVFFRIDGEIDPATLPSTPAASMQPGASMFLLDIDPSSPTAFSRVPIECRWNASAQTLTARPSRGEPLSGGRKYALALTNGVRDDEGAPLKPSPLYEAVLAADAVPAIAAEAAVYRAHINAISAVENVGVDRDDIAALAVFTVQDVRAGLEPLVTQAQEFVPSMPVVTRALTGAGLDAALGVPEVGVLGVHPGAGVAHENTAWLIQGVIAVPNYLSGVAAENGRFGFDSTGGLITQRVESVPFTLCLPMLEASDTTQALPLVLFQHGLGRDRADVLPLANVLNAAGYAVLAIDAPFHGLRRASAGDVTHRFVDLEAADGFVDGDSSAGAELYMGAIDAGGDRPRLHPAYVRDANRQNVSDWLVLLRALSTDPMAWLGQVDTLPPISFVLDRVGFVGIDVGGQVGTILSSLDVGIGANVLALTGGGLAEWILDSPALSALSDALLRGVGLDPAEIDYVSDAPLLSPSIALWQTLADGGDALAFAPNLRRARRDLLMVSVRDDETVSNRTTEALAGALRLPHAGAGQARFVELPHIGTPVAQNATIGGELATQALFEHAVASHSLYAEDQGTLRFDVAAMPPFSLRESPETIDNPIEAALTQTVFFFESWRAGSATIVDPVAQQRVPAQ